MPRPINTMTKLGTARSQSQITADALAEVSGVSVNSIKRIEMGIYRMTPAMAIRLAQHLNVRPRTLLEPEAIDELRAWASAILSTNSD